MRFKTFFLMKRLFHFRRKLDKIIRRLLAHNSREEAIPLKKIWLLMLLFLSAALLAGCASQADTSPASPSPEATGLIESILPGMTDRPDVNPTAGAMATDDPSMPGAGIERVEDAQTRSKAMEEAIEKLSEVENAYVAAAGHTALVGLEFTKQYQGKVDDRMKKMVLTRVQTVEKGVTGVAVTDDAEMVKKIREISESLDNAASMSAVKAQVDELARDIKVYTE